MYKELEILPQYTPDYVIDEMKYYLDKKRENKSGIFTFENAMSLVNLAKVNKRITSEQAKNIKRILKKIKKGHL